MVGLGGDCCPIDGIGIGARCIVLAQGIGVVADYEINQIAEGGLRERGA